MENLDIQIGELTDLNRVYSGLERAQTRLDLQVKAYLRNYLEHNKHEKLIDEEGRTPAQIKYAKDKLIKEFYEEWKMAVISEPSLIVKILGPLLDAKAAIQPHREMYGKKLEQKAKEFPLWPWAENIKGLGAQSFGRLLGETGNISRFSNPAKLWKRMGIGIWDGKIQKKISSKYHGSGKAETNKKIAIEMGFSPKRRALVYIIGDSLIKLNKDNKQDGFYRKLYLERKVYELTKVETLGHAHNRAKRYMEKRLLKNLWIEWHNYFGENIEIKEEEKVYS